MNLREACSAEKSACLSLFSGYIFQPFRSSAPMNSNQLLCKWEIHVIKVKIDSWTGNQCQDECKLLSKLTLTSKLTWVFYYCYLVLPIMRNNQWPLKRGGMANKRSSYNLLANYPSHRYCVGPCNANFFYFIRTWLMHLIYDNAAIAQNKERAAMFGQTKRPKKKTLRNATAR